MWDERSIRMVMALLFIIILGVVLSYSLLPYVNAFFGAFILFVIFRPLYLFLHERLKIKQSISALTVISITLILVVIPSYFLITTIIGEIQKVLENTDFIIYYIRSIDALIPQFDIEQTINEQISAIGEFISRLLLSAIQEAGRQLIIFIIMYFLLYYLFVWEECVLMNAMYTIAPFNEKNVDILVEDFKSVVNASLIATGLIALFQGVVLTISFLIFGVEGAFLWGFIAAILTFLPLVGAPIIWVPAAIIKLVQQDIFAGVGILIIGLLASNLDNFLRPMIQKKIGEIHPLISILGIFIGISLFGLIGVVVGPLLLTYFILTLRMFYEEFLEIEL